MFVLIDCPRCNSKTVVQVRPSLDGTADRDPLVCSCGEKLNQVVYGNLENGTENGCISRIVPCCEAIEDLLLCEDVYIGPEGKVYCDFEINKEIAPIRYCPFCGSKIELSKEWK